MIASTPPQMPRATRHHGPIQLGEKLLIAALTFATTNCSDSNQTDQTTESQAPTVPNAVATTQESLNMQLNDYLASVTPGQLGISVLMARGGRMVYSNNRGMANTLTNAPVTSHTGFRLASVSKPFTAVAVMQLVERGELQLDDLLLDYVPELPDSYQNITVDHLLSHRSGIIDIFNDFWNPSLFQHMTLDGLVSYLGTEHEKLEFEPGTKGDYSNTGYMLLAKLIERRTGATFSEHMAENVFNPAGMDDSYINDEYKFIEPDDALNFGNRTTYYGYTNFFKGSMAQVSSTDDFLHFFQALREGKLVSEETLTEMTTSHGDLRKVGAYGYGFFVGDETYRHLGEWDGFCTLVSFDTARDRAWVVLTNSGATGWAQLSDIDEIISRAN